MCVLDDDLCGLRMQEEKEKEMDARQTVPRSVEEVFDDFRGRRAALIKALTTGIFMRVQSFNVGILFVCVISCVCYVCGIVDGVVI